MPRFKVGEHVVVAMRPHPGHVRTPIYIRGKRGCVEEVVGSYPNPELLGYGKDGSPAEVLYRVCFRQAELWDGYAGRPEDFLHIDLYEHWLVPAGN